MTFTLNVDISGLCLYLRHPGNPNRVTLLMPDRRSTSDGLKTPADQPPPHVGYLRFFLENLANGVRGIASRDDGDNLNEVVHRFDRERLQFGLEDDAGAIDLTELRVPDFDVFAPELKLLDHLLDAQPPAELLMRTELFGGSLSTVPDDGLWVLSTEDVEKGRTDGIKLGGETRWTRSVRGSRLTIRLLEMDGDGALEIPLLPTPGPDGAMQITLKLANLCATNPLEWRTLDYRRIDGPDEDFKQLYSLYVPRTDGGKLLLKRPVPVEGSYENEGDLQDCFSARGTYAGA